MDRYDVVDHPMELQQNAAYCTQVQLQQNVCYATVSKHENDETVE